MLRAIAGIVVGYLIFAVPSFLVFRLMHVDPHVPASPAFEAIAVVYGIVFALLGGYLGTAVSGKQNALDCIHDRSNHGRRCDRLNDRDRN